MTVTDTSDRLNEPRASQWIFSASPSDQTCARAQKWTSTEHKQWPPKGSCSTNVMQKDPSFFVWGDFSWSSKWRNIDWTCFWCFCCFFLLMEPVQWWFPEGVSSSRKCEDRFSSSILSTHWTQIFSVVSVPFSANIWLAMNLRPPLKHTVGIPVDVAFKRSTSG